MKIGRNDPCPCGSGKKYKKCCLDKLPPFLLSKEILIKEKFIERKTGNEVILKERNNIGVNACIDFPNWNDMTKLPRILHKSSVTNVDILHELIHLEKFFVDQYSIIACNNRGLHPIIAVFKNIPEDYVAHKIIKYEYNRNPINKSWFLGKDNLTLPDKEIAANLVNYHAFCEFCPEYNKKLNSFFQLCQQQRETAFLIEDKVVKALESMDYRDKDSCNQCADEIIKIFASEYHRKKSIYLSYFSKVLNEWRWNP